MGKHLSCNLQHFLTGNKSIGCRLTGFNVLSSVHCFIELVKKMHLESLSSVLVVSGDRGITESGPQCSFVHKPDSDG